MKKKYASKVLAAAMAVSMVVPGVNVLAADTPKTTDSTTLKYYVTQEYEWSIHTEIDFGTDKAGTESTVNKDADNGVKITKNIIPDGKKLSIKIDPKQEFTIANGNTKLNYKVYNANAATGNELTKGAEVVSADAGTNTASTAMTFVLSTNTTEVAGNYTGTITYTASIEEK